jgi:hypothetical protein
MYMLRDSDRVGVQGTDLNFFSLKFPFSSISHVRLTNTPRESCNQEDLNPLDNVFPRVAIAAVVGHP